MQLSCCRDENVVNVPCVISDGSFHYMLLHNSKLDSVIHIISLLPGRLTLHSF